MWIRCACVRSQDSLNVLNLFPPTLKDAKMLKLIFFNFKWYYERSWIQEKNFFNYENLCHCENTPFMHIRIRETISNGPVRGLRDDTRRQYIKYSTGKLFILPSGLTIKTTRRMASAKCSRATIPALACPTDGVSIGWFTNKPGGQQKGRPFTTVGLKCCTAIPENANIGAANTYRVALLIVIQATFRTEVAEA